MAGCGDSGGSPHRSPDAGQVDAQVMQDVVEWAFPLPGAASQERARRIDNFTNNLSIKECDGTPAPLDYVDDTAGDEYPDLELIRTRGLAPIYDALKYYHLKHEYGSDESVKCAHASEQCRAAGKSGGPGSKAYLECEAEQKRVHPVSESSAYQTAFNDAFVAGVTWQNDTMLTVANAEVVLAAAKPAAQCLRQGSGLQVTDDDPANSFGGAVNTAYFRHHPAPVSVETMWKWSRLYADCMENYFEVVKRELSKQRPALVERYREQLEAFAAELVKLGYVP